MRMPRRTFLKSALAASAAPTLGSAAASAAPAATGRDYY